MVAGADLVQRRIERLAAEHAGLAVIKPPEARVEPGGERIRLQQPVTEAVNRRDPGAVKLAREVIAAAVEQLPPDPPTELARRALRVRDNEHGADINALVAHSVREPLDEIGRAHV